MSTSIGVLLALAACSICCAKFKNLLLNRFLAYRSASSCSSSSMSLNFCLPPVKLMSSAATPLSLENWTSCTFLFDSKIGVTRWKWSNTISSSDAHGWKKQCLMFEKQMSTFSPFYVMNRTPFWWISRLPSVFLPTKLGLITRFSNYSFLADFNKMRLSNSFSPCICFTSVSVSKVLADFWHS